MAVRGSGGCRGASQVPPPVGSASPPPPAGGGTGTGTGSSPNPGSGGTSGTGGTGGTGGSGVTQGLVDVLQYMIPPAGFSNNFHYASKQPGVNPQFIMQQPMTATSGWIWYIKNPGGFPWDINWYNENYVFQVVTEGVEGWTNPSSYKIFVSDSWANNKGGIAWSPRYIGSPPFESLTTANSSYQTWLGGAQQGATQNLGTVMCRIEGPYNLACGDLGTVPVLVQSYFWNPGFTMKEVNWYGFQLGLIRWQEYALVSGVYKLTIDNIFDQKKPGGTPAPVFQGTLP